MFELAALYPDIKVTMIVPGPVMSNFGKYAMLDDASKVTCSYILILILRI